MTLLVAGFSGQLGAGLVEAARNQELVPLVRPIRARGARARVERLHPGREDLAEATETGDVTEPLWGLDDTALDRLAERVDGVLNVAAETNWAAARRQLHRVNVLGAAHGADVAAELARRRSEPVQYIYAGSIHAAGDRDGWIGERPFEPNAGRTPYEQSKWLAERTLLSPVARSEGVRVRIARVGGIVGNSETGATAKRNSLYMLPDRWDDMPGRFLPISPRGRVDMMPRDRVGEMLLDYARSTPDGDEEIVHVCAGESAPTVEALLDSVRSLDLTGARSRPRTVPVSPRPLVWASQHLERFHKLSITWRNALTGVRYLAFERLFERDRLAGALGSRPPTTSAEQLARLAFELPARAPEPWRGDLSLARFHA